MAVSRHDHVSSIPCFEFIDFSGRWDWKWRGSSHHDHDNHDDNYDNNDES